MTLLMADVISPAKLRAIALKSDLQGVVEKLFASFGKRFDESEYCGQLAVLMDAGGDYITASSHLKPEDIRALEIWGKDQGSNRISPQLHKAALSEFIYIFRPYRDNSGHRTVLLGCLIRKSDDARIMLTVAQVRQMHAESMKEQVCLTN